MMPLQQIVKIYLDLGQFSLQLALRHPLQAANQAQPIKADQVTNQGRGSA